MFVEIWKTVKYTVEKLPVLAVVAIVVWSYAVFVSKILVTFEIGPAGMVVESDGETSG